MFLGRPQMHGAEDVKTYMFLGRPYVFFRATTVAVLKEHETVAVPRGHALVAVEKHVPDGQGVWPSHKTCAPWRKEHVFSFCLRNTNYLSPLTRGG